MDKCLDNPKESEGHDDECSTNPTEDYVERCRDFLCENADLAHRRVEDLNFSGLNIDTSSFSVPRGTAEEQNAYIDTLPEDQIIAFAQLLHLCKGFDEAECDYIYDEGDIPDEDYFNYDEPPSVNKLDEVGIILDDDGSGVCIFFSEKVGCNGRKECSCCTNRYAYILDAVIPSVEHLVTFNKHFSLDTIIEETWCTV
jgi:hypothetical protein